jgi:hypothetical protein
MNSTSHLSFFSSRSSSSDSSLSSSKKIRSLDDLYKIINPIDDDLSLYCHLATCKSIVFVKEINDEK